MKSIKKLTVLLFNYGIISIITAQAIYDFFNLKEV